MTTEDLYECESCGKRLASEDSAVWLEKDLGGQIVPEGSIPEDDSLGLFPFGRDCARKALASEALRRFRGVR